MLELTKTSCQQVPANIDALPDWQQEKYDAHLQAWFNENQPSDKMIYKEGYNRQCIFIRDNFGIMFDDILEKIEVISTHTSKSIKLPVYHIVMKDVEIIMRDNFYDWKVSVISNNALEFPCELFSNPEKQITHHYCEGFDKSWIFAPYMENKQQFTVEIYNNNLLYVFLFLLKLQLKKSKFYKTSFNLIPLKTSTSTLIMKYSKEIQQEITELKKHVALRDQMGGNLYYNMVNDECCQKAQTLADKGV